MEKKRRDEDREQLEREQEILGDRFVFNEHEWIELITEEEEEGYKELIETEGELMRTNRREIKG